jgi:hypothetical protein
VKICGDFGIWLRRFEIGGILKAESEEKTIEMVLEFGLVVENHYRWRLTTTKS